jgi:hypothetical protein
MGIRQIALVVSLSWAASCGDAPGEASKTDDTAVQAGIDTLPLITEPPAFDDSTLRAFLLSEPGTYGWQTASDKITLDFFPDGRLHIQGPDGEATMWEGKWKVEAHTLIMDRPDLGGKRTVTMVLDNDGSLLLGDKKYTRYRP